jgi:molybdenum cofactor cytidylyltransferase
VVRFGAVILAAGRSSRFHAPFGGSKLLAPWRGEPMIRCVAQEALESGAEPVVVVTGHAREGVEAALRDLPLRFVHNEDFADGLSASLRCGVAALPAEVRGALILLGDMPSVGRDTMAAILRAGATAPSSCDAIVPSFAGRPGNPVLLLDRIFDLLKTLQGDRGAGELLKKSGNTLPLAVADSGVLFDVDSFDDLSSRDRGEKGD